ncbi:MAG: DUF2007 domain-containing protein [Eubacteriales bacterium]|nr:DUF2007 domain-containing protein [Eubacteriales bacterium]
MLFGKKEEKETHEEWRDGVYLTTTTDSLQADILESKLRGEGIPCLRKYKGAGNAMEIMMGSNIGIPIDLYVPAAALEDAKNIIVAIPILSDEFDENSVISDEELERQALAAGSEDEDKR